MMQIREPAFDQSANEVERERRAAVAAQQKLRIGRAVGGGIFGPVDQIAPVGGQSNAVASFEVLRPRLGVLAGETAHTNHRTLAAVNEYHAHLEQDAQLVGDQLRHAVAEALGAVAALQ